MWRPRTALTLLAGTVLIASLAADEAHSLGRNGSTASKQVDSAFERFKQLVGDWEATTASKEFPKGKIQARYRLTAGGSALVETLFPGDEMEMVTVYHRDGDQLMLTHYCHIGNQPRMRTTRIDNDRELSFEFVGGGNLDPAKEMHMHSARIWFDDADHIHSAWQLFRYGKAAEVHQLNLVRKK